MKNKISKASAALAIAVAAVFAAPAVASAYTPDPPAVAPIIAPGGTATVPFSGFAANEGVEFTLTGENASGATLAFVAFAVETKSVTKEANADGVASVDVTLPANASGSYELVATGLESDATASTTIKVAATGSGAGGEGGGGVLQNTGFDGDALLGLWVGGGVLVLAGASIAVATSVRRARRA